MQLKRIQWRLSIDEDDSFPAFDLKVQKKWRNDFQLSTFHLFIGTIPGDCKFCPDHVWREVMESTNQYVSDELRGLSRRGGHQRNRYGGGRGKGIGKAWIL